MELFAENEDAKVRLDKRIDSIAWGVFLIMVGALWCFPDGVVPEGTWMFGTGLILLGVIIARHIGHIQVTGFWVVMCGLALGAGLTSMLGLPLPVLPIIMIMVGAGIIVKTVVKIAQKKD